MDVVFIIRRKDLKRAIKELRANRGQASKTDLAYLLVSEYAVTFQAMGTESEYPVNGVQPGSAQLPIAVLDRIANMRTSMELALRVTNGAISCGKATVRHEAVTVGKIPDGRVSLPIDPSAFELIVIGRILGESGAAEQGIKSRLEKALGEMDQAVSQAASILADYRVTRLDLASLVEKTIMDCEPSIKKGILV